MGNNLNVDSKVSQIDDIISFPLEHLNNIELEKEQGFYKNIKLWRFYEKEDNKIESEAVVLPSIWKNEFLLNSLEAYIVLLIDKGVKEQTEISSFPLNLWGIIESSTNMTPRGLKYAFSTSEDKSENLESFMLSKRKFINSDFKYVLFIWNGKNCSSQIKSTVLMKAFDLDKKISNPSILPFLYYGYYINSTYNLQKGGVVKLSEIVSNSIDHVYDDVLPTPSSETIDDFQETVYLLHWLYPNSEKKNEKKHSNKILKKIYTKFNQNFLNASEKTSYYDCFTVIKDNGLNSLSEENTFLNKKSINEEMIDDQTNGLYKLPKMDEAYINKDLLQNEIDKNQQINMDVDYDQKNEVLGENIEDSNDEYDQEEDVESDYDDDSLNEINFTDVIPLTNNKLGVKKLNIEEIYKKKNSMDVDYETVKKKQIIIPKISMKLQHKISNPTDRSKQLSEDEERLDSLGTTTIRKASDIIKGKLKFSNKALNLNLNLKSNIKSKLGENNITEADENDNRSFRKELLMDYFSKNISEIIDGFLFLSSYNVAKNREIVFQNKITHIINSASDVCQNHFEKEIQYLNYNLKDHSMENIECLFYEAIHFIESAQESGGRILVHCIQGISRSVTLVLAYLIYKNKINYEEAFKIVQEKRSIASPNLGFSIQLQIFYQRLYEPADSFRFYPKVFSVGSFQLEQPEKIVCKLNIEPFYEIRPSGYLKAFDKRGLFIVVTLGKVYLWFGSEIFENVYEFYLEAARSHIKNIQKYEAASNQVIEVRDGHEDEEFIKIWFDSDEKLEKYRINNRFSEIVSEMNYFYKDVDISLKRKEKLNEMNFEREDLIEEVSNSWVNSKPQKAFFIFPEEKIPENLIDIEDLTDNEFLVACVENCLENKFIIYSWKGSSVQIDQNEEMEYINKIKQNFFAIKNLDEVTIIEENPYNESDDFINLL